MSVDQSQIKNLVQDLASKADKLNVYTKDQTDDQLDLKTNVTDFNTLSQTVSEKANQSSLESLSAVVDQKANQSDVYTQAEADALLAQKAEKIHSHSITDIEKLEQTIANLSSLVNLSPEQLTGPSFFDGHWNGIILFNDPINFTTPLV